MNWLAVVVGCVLSANSARIWRKNSKKEAKIMGILDNLKAEIKATGGWKVSVKAAFDGLSAKLAALAGQETVDPAELQALADELHSDNADFAALIAANPPTADGSTSSAHPDNAANLADVPKEPTA